MDRGGVDKGRSDSAAPNLELDLGRAVPAICRRAVEPVPVETGVLAGFSEATVDVADSALRALSG